MEYCVVTRYGQAADFPRDVCLTVSRDHAVFLFYPILIVHYHFWLVNNREIYTGISRWTPSTWYIKVHGRHGWRHNGDSDRRPLTLPLWFDRVTLRLYDDLSQINGIAGIIKPRKRFLERGKHRSSEHGINPLLLVCWRGYGNSSTLSSIAIPRLAFCRAWYCDAACGSIPVSASSYKG